MHSPIPIPTTLLILPLLTTTLAQEPTTSAPFHLHIDQPNTKRDNITLYACSAGGPYHALCPDYLAKGTTNFHLNSTATPTNNSSGILTLDVVYDDAGYTGKYGIGRGGRGLTDVMTASHPLVFSFNPTSNVATPLFSGTDTVDALSVTTVYFDESGHLGIRTNYDDSVETQNLGEWVTYYKWYICEVWDGEKKVETLSWVVGKYDTPQNPSCESVGVRRVWAE